MFQNKLKLQVVKNYSENRRYKVGQSVLFDGKEYSNVNGLNSLPNLLIDWILLTAITVINAPFNTFKFIQKGFGNTGPQNPPQAGDVYSGHLDDGSQYCPVAYYRGTGLLNTHTSFNVFNPLFVKHNNFTIYKHPLNNNPVNANILEINDVGVGFFADNTFMPFGMYLGGDPTIADSWNTGVMFTP